MNHEQAGANLQLVLDWIGALRGGDVESIADHFQIECAVAVGLGMAGNVVATLYALALAVLALLLRAWRSPRISKR
jgi:hypothetical protein